MDLPGKTGEIEKLVDAHYVCLYRYAYRLTGSVADAEDLTQEAFCQAQAKLGQLREASKVKAWLFRILRNIYLLRLRNDRRHGLISLDDIGELPEAAAEPVPDIEPGQLQQALNELPEIFRTPVILFYFEDFSYRDIAEQMDLPIGTVMSRLARSKAFLRSRLLAPVREPLAKGVRRTNDGL
jgi:RNA polymerase sigma-70 factor (ECF subfamily)